MINLETKQLKEAFTLINTVLRKHPIMPILQNIRIKTDGVFVELEVTNLEVTLKIKYFQVIQNPHSNFLIQKKYLKTNCDLIQINVELQTLVAGGFKAKLELDDIGDYPNMAKELPHVFDIEFSDFKSICDLQKFVTSDELRPSMTGINFVYGSGLKVVASDGHMLVKKRFLAVNDTGIMGEFVCGRRTFDTIKRIKGIDWVIVEADKSHCKFTIKDKTEKIIEITSRLINQKYPDFEAVIPTNYTNWFSFDRKEAIEAFKAIDEFTDETTNEIRIFPLAQKIIPTNHYYLDIAHDLKMDYHGSLEKVAFRNSFMIKLLSASKDKEIKMEFTNANKPFFFKEKSEHSDTTYLIMPVIIY